ncbi:MAG: TIM barrel protein, partial [Clostridiaceae bacterium]
DYFRALGKDLVHIHFIDGKPRGHLAWGDGILPLEKYVESLNSNNYEGYLTLEITDSGYLLNPEKAVGKSIEKLKKALG